MSGLYPDGGPYFTADGRSYYMVNGQCVWGTSGHSNHGSMSFPSSQARAHSVFSDYQSTWQPCPIASSQSYPPMTSTSDMRNRMMFGYPSTLYGVGGSAGSTPAYPASYVSAYGDRVFDPYRNAARPESSRHGPIFGSPFAAQANQYKDLDVAADAGEFFYKRHLDTATKTTSRMRKQNPGVYAGDPPETAAWHQSAAQYADTARNQYIDAQAARARMASDYVGYDTYKDAAGHRDREKKLLGGADHFDKKHSQHSRSHSRRH
ncbi:hypothetical protein ANO11243_042120 [Dothideomycetidae sp. 11243]|nr:hypothetical protein ANO11243_042120 [fungal sp. No.11243]